MAAIHDLLAQIQDEGLRRRIEQEVNKLSKTKKFGLVFEEHLPECTPLYDMPVKKGVNVMLRNSKEDKSIYTVLKIDGDNVSCAKKDNHQDLKEFNINDIVRVAEFGEPIYPYLKPLDSVCNAPDSDLWHTLIEADNYHALQLLEYLYAGKVDCIYIDPPYNTGAKDWKYNNDYIDETDTFRHSKWLSFIEKRLKIAKKILNPNDSVLIVTIDEKEYLHLGCLLEDLFPEARIQMISSIISRKGTARSDEFSRTNEFIYYVRFGNCCIEKLNDVKSVSGESEVHWQPLRRSDLASKRGTKKGGTAQFYPIYVSMETGKIVHIGKPLSPNDDIKNVPKIEGAVPVFPIRDNGIEMNWGLIGEELNKRVQAGFVKVGKYSPNKPQKYVLTYLTSGTIDDINSGKATISGYSDDGSVKAYYSEGKKSLPTTQWDNPFYDAKVYGTGINALLMPDRIFPFPKSLYAVEDCLDIILRNKKDALIVDFFAGSGTTCHAVMRLNNRDNGHRRCISITNNEISENEEKALKSGGYSEIDEIWLDKGICRYFTFPRIKSAITGIDSTGNLIEGNYQFNDERPISDGFNTNVIFFKLGFLDKTAVALGLQFEEMIPTLWMKAGAKGKCPELDGDSLPSMMILPENKFAVLRDENAFSEFAEKLTNYPEIQTVFIITDYEVNYRSMVKALNVETTYQLYRDYLDNFRINHGRN